MPYASFYMPINPACYSKVFSSGVDWAQHRTALQKTNSQRSMALGSVAQLRQRKYSLKEGKPWGTKQNSIWRALQHHISQRNAAQLTTAQRRAIWQHMQQLSMACLWNICRVHTSKHNRSRRSAAQHSTAQHCSARQTTAQHSMTQHSLTHHSPA